MEARYSIGAVARMTGVAPETLRAWERRYRAVAPARDEHGRTYSDAEVHKLRLLAALTARGHTIGRIVGLSLPELESLREKAAAVPATRTLDLDSLYLALEAFDAMALDRELGRFASLLAPREFVIEVAVPFLRGVGEGWHTGRFSVAHEHLASAAVRTALGALVRLAGSGAGKPRIIFATPSGERHEFGLLGAALLATTAGAFPLYLGPDLPAEDVELAVRQVNPVAVVVAATGAQDADRVLGSLRALVERMPPGVPVLAGGAQSAGFAERVAATGVEYLPSLDAFEQRLAVLV